MGLMGISVKCTCHSFLFPSVFVGLEGFGYLLYRNDMFLSSVIAVSSVIRDLNWSFAENVPCRLISPMMRWATTNLCGGST